MKTILNVAIAKDGVDYRFEFEITESESEAIPYFNWKADKGEGKIQNAVFVFTSNTYTKEEQDRLVREGKIGMLPELQKKTP